MIRYLPAMPLLSNRYFRSLSDEDLEGLTFYYGANISRKEREIRRRASKSKVAIAQADAQGEP